MATHLPNFLHLGPGKSGSTWLHEALSTHPEVFLTPAKDLYFFSRYYHRGADWYRRQFSLDDAPPVVGEVCPDYLAAPGAAERIAETLGPDVRLMVTLRDPVERAFSSYLYLKKHGLAQPTFRETAQEHPELIDEGRYGTQLRRFLDHFERESIRVALFDDFVADPQKFYDGMTDWLGVGRQTLTSEQLEAQLPASRARFLPVAIAAQRTADWLRGHDAAGIVGRVKRSSTVQRLMYTPLGEDRPRVSEADAAYFRDLLEDEVTVLEQDFRLTVKSRWDWG